MSASGPAVNGLEIPRSVRWPEGDAGTAARQRRGAACVFLEPLLHAERRLVRATRSSSVDRDQSRNGRAICLGDRRRRSGRARHGSVR